MAGSEGDGQPVADVPLRAHLVLGAGGAKSLGYAGVLSALRQEGVAFASISACSSGTFFGACIAAGVDPELLVERTLTADTRKFIGPRSALGPLSAFRWPRARYTASGLPALFEELVGRDDLRFRDLSLPFSTIAVDLISARILVYSEATTPDMLVVDAIRVATAVPFMYPPHDAGERVVVDGALASPCPVWLAMQHPDDLPVVAVLPRRDLVHPSEEGLSPFIRALVELGGASRDLYVIDQMRRACLVEVDACGVREDELELSKAKRALLVNAGRTAVRTSMNELRLLASGAVPGASPALPAIPTMPADASDDVRAEVGGATLLARSNERLSSEIRDAVFISYAHEDRDWMARVRTHLVGRLHGKRHPIWDDSHIPAGAPWLPTLHRALRGAKVVVVLVSPEFLASQFIRSDELPAILEATGEGAVVVWALLRSSAYDATALKDLQAAHDVERPIETLARPEQEKVLDSIARQVALALA